MGHGVAYRSIGGEVRFEEVPSLDAAVERVERLRNSGEASDVRVFREVPLTVRTYYRVSVAEEAAREVAATPAPANGTSGEPTAAADGDEPPSGAMPLKPAPVAAGAASDSDETRKHSLFGRG